MPGERVDPVDLEAVRLLGALTPELIGSEAPALTLSVDDESGYVLEWPDHWRAVFGHYTRTLLPPDRIPAQVQCLGELLREREDSVVGATLAVSADRCGTFLPGAPEPTRRPRRTQRPTRRRSPDGGQAWRTRGGPGARPTLTGRDRGAPHLRRWARQGSTGDRAPWARRDGAAG